MSASRNIGLIVAALIFAIRSVSASTLSKEVLPISMVDNRAFVDVKVNGQGLFYFLLDTGSSVTTVSPELAKRLNLRKVRDGNGGGAGEQKVSYSVFNVASVTLGASSIGPLNAPAIDLTELAHVIGFQRCDGVLGAEIFQKHVITINATNTQVTVEDPTAYHANKNAIGVPFELEDKDALGMPIISGSVNGVTGAFEIDTGDRSSLTLFGPFWTANHLDGSIGSTVRTMTGYGVGGPIRSIVGRPHEFTMGGVLVPAPVTRLSVQKAGSFTRSTYAGSIGMGILKRFFVSFDYPHKTMWLQRSPQFEAPDQYDRSGLWLGEINDGGLSATDVTDGGPAARAGLTAGDEIIDVNGTPASSKTLFDIRGILRKPDLSIAVVHARHKGELKTYQISLQNQVDPVH